MEKLLYYVLTAILLCGCGQREKSKDCATAANAIWQFDDQEIGDWESVERGYNQLKGQLDSMNNPDYDYSYDEKVNALSEDEETFKAFMHIHEALLRKLGISDSRWSLHLKAQTLERFDQYDDIDRFQIN